MSGKSFNLRKLFLFVYLGTAIYYYCTLDREKALAWIEKVAIKTAIVYAEHQTKGKAPVQPVERQPASLEAELQPAKPPPAEIKIEILARAPDLKIGQTMKFHYQINDMQIQKPVKEKTLEWELVSLANKQAHWEDGDGTSEVFSAIPFLPPVSASGNYIRHAEKNSISGDFESVFPLTYLKTMTFAIRENESLSYSLTCTVGQLTPRSTPAGAFKTVPVSCVASAPAMYNEIFYYSPQLSHWVFREKDYVVNGTPYHLKAELTGFNFPDPSLRKPAAH